MTSRNYNEVQEQRKNSDYAIQGGLAPIGPNDLVTNDPALMRKMMAVRSPYTRAEWYDAMRFNPERDSLLSMRDEAEHAKLRAKMAAGVGDIPVESRLDFARVTLTKRCAVLRQGERVHGGYD